MRRGKFFFWRGKPQEAWLEPQRAGDAGKAAEAERDELRMCVRELEAPRPKGHGPVVQHHRGCGLWGGRGGATTGGAGGGGGWQHLFGVA